MGTIDEVIEYLRRSTVYVFLVVTIMIALMMVGGIWWVFDGIWWVYTSFTFIVLVFILGVVLGFAILIVLISSVKIEVV